MSEESRPKKFHPSLIPSKAQFYEWQVRKIEYLGIMCADGIPTPEQEGIASDFANAWLEKQPLESCRDTFDDPTIEPVY